MKITGIAHAPERLHERSCLPSGELVYLAKMALKEYGATHVITSLALGWEQALAKAALEMEIPYTVALPYPGRDAEWDREARTLYLDLLARASGVVRVSDTFSDTAMQECHEWCAEEADLVVALWDYVFHGAVFAAMTYASQQGKPVVNLWQDWHHLYSLRRKNPVVMVAREEKPKRGAQVFDRNEKDLSGPPAR